MKCLPERLVAAAEKADDADALNLRRELIDSLPGLRKLVKACENGAGRDLLQAWDRWRPALELVGKATRELQPENVLNVQVALWQELGVRDKDEAQRLIGDARRVNGLDEHQAAAECRRYLAWYEARYPAAVGAVGNGGGNGATANGT